MAKEENEYISYLLNNDAKGISKIYKEYLPRIERIIGGIGGTKDDSWEIFQESLIVILKKAQTPDFQLSSSFYTFLVSVCKFKWYNESKKKYRKNVTIEDNVTLKDDLDIEEAFMKLERFKLYKSKLEELDPGCRQLFEYFLNKVPLKEIAKKMGFSTENAAKQKKYKCQKKLIENVRKDHKFKQLI